VILIELGRVEDRFGESPSSSGPCAVLIRFISSFCPCPPLLGEAVALLPLASPELCVSGVSSDPAGLSLTVDPIRPKPFFEPAFRQVFLAAH
jgi:hypothetical protein